MSAARIILLEELDGKPISENERIFLRNLAKQKKEKKSTSKEVTFGAIKKPGKTEAKEDSNLINI